MSDLIQVDQCVEVLAWWRIRRHVIARTRAGQPVPGYRVNDNCFDRMVENKNLQIYRRNGVAWTVLRFGRMTAYVYPGEPTPDEYIDGEHVKLIEDHTPPQESRCCHCGAVVAEG